VIAPRGCVTTDTGRTGYSFLYGRASLAGGTPVQHKGVPDTARVGPAALICDAHEWITEIPTVPTYYLAKPQPRERAWHN